MKLINYCSNIGNEFLEVVGQYCPNMKIVVLKNCLLIRDHEIVDLFSSAGQILTKVKFHFLKNDHQKKANCNFLIPISVHFF